MEDRMPLEHLPLIDGRRYRIRTTEDGQPMVTYGGGSILYFAVDENNRKMVIKELFPRKCAYRKADGMVAAIPGKREMFEYYREAFCNEAKLLCSATTATHHVKGDFEVFDGRFAVMRKMPEDTQSLMELIPKRLHIRNEENLLWTISAVKRILEAVEKLHQEEGVLHLDLSLGNVFASCDKTGPEAYILDFGNSMNASSMQKLSYRPSGTAHFAAPELENGTFSEPTPSADLFSIGLIFFHLLCSNRGYYANKEIHEANILVGNRRYLERALDSLEYSPAEKKAILDFISRAIEYLPENRFQTAASMLQAAEELERTISRKGISRSALWAGSHAYYQQMWKDDYDLDLFVDAICCDITDPDRYLFDKEQRRFRWEHLEENMIDAIKRKNCLLISNGGAAKTTYLHRLWGQLLDVLANEEDAPVPVFIGLQEYRNLKNQEHYILDEILDNYFCGVEHSETTRRLLINTLAEGTVLILDSYNEAVAPETLDAQIEVLQKKGIRIILASRYDMGRDMYQDFARAKMEKVSNNIILRKLAENNLQLPDTRILDILKVPQYLLAYLQADKNRVITSAGMLILERMRTISKQAGLLGHHDEASLREYGLEVFLPRIASQTKGMIFDFETAEIILSDAPKCRRYASIPTKENLCFRLLRAMLNCGILEYTGTNEYRFVHQNYRDVLRALHLGNQIKNGVVPEELTAELVQPEVAAFLGDVLEERKALTKHTPSPIGALLETMKHLRGGSHQIVIANLVFVLAIAREYDLRGFSFYGLDLSFVDFTGCDLTGASFRKAKLSCTSITPMGHQVAVEELLVVPTSGLLATWCGYEKEILLWDPEGHFVQRLCPDLGAYTMRTATVSFSPNGKLAAILSPECLSLCEVNSGEQIARLPRDLFSTISEEFFSRITKHRLEEKGVAHEAVHVGFSGNRQLVVSTALVSFRIDFGGNLLGICRFGLPEKTTKGLKSLAVSGDGKWLCCATGEQIIRYQAKTLLPRRSDILERENGPAERLAVSADGQTYRLGYTFDGADDYFFNGKMEKITVTGHGAGCLSNRYIAKRGRENVYWRSVKDLAASERSAPVHGAFRLAISNDETELYVATYNCEILVFSLETGKLLRTFMIGRKYVLYSDLRYPYIRSFCKERSACVTAASIKGADFRTADIDEIIKGFLKANGAVVE